MNQEKLSKNHCAIIRQNLFKVNAPCASGKTHGLIKQVIADSTAGIKSIIALPTKKLIVEIRADYPDLLSKENLRIITSDNDDLDKVSNGIKDAMMFAQPGTILLITHAALFAIDDEIKQSDWNLWIDEIIDPVIYENVKISKAHVNDFIELVKEAELVDGHLEIKYNDLSKAILDNRDELVWSMPFFREISSRIKSSHWSVLIKDDWMKTWKATGFIHFFEVLHKSIFKEYRQVVVLGAGFDFSLLNLIWRDFRPFQLPLRYSSHSMPNMVINYFIDTRYSKYTRNRYGLHDYLIKALGELEEEILISTNNDTRKADNITVKCHGLNGYSDLDCMAFIAALNPKPEYMSFLNNFLNISDDQYYLATTVTTAYQNIMRLFRKCDFDKAARIYVVDTILAESLNKNFFARSALLNKVAADIELPEKKKALTNAEKQKKYRERRKVASMLKARK